MEKNILVKILFALIAIIFAVFLNDCLGGLQNLLVEHNFPTEIILGPAFFRGIGSHFANSQFWIGIGVLIITELFSTGIARIYIF